MTWLDNQTGNTSTAPRRGTSATSMLTTPPWGRDVSTAHQSKDEELSTDHITLTIDGGA
jgi:hypothetical protein